MNRDNVKLFPLLNEYFEKADLKPGCYTFDTNESNLLIVLPGSKRVDCIPVTRDRKKAEKNKRMWYLTGPISAPTLYPSINHEGHWHGWLKEGVLQSC